MRFRAWVVGLGVACGGDGAGDTGAPETACGGAGDPVLEIGTGGQLSFTPWVNGDTVVIAQDGGGRYGFYADLSTHGLDTTADSTVFVRYSVGSETETEDVGATLTLLCVEEVAGWYGLFVPLDEAQQDATVVAGLEGLGMHLTGSLTDQAGETGSVDLDLVIGL